MLPFSLSFEPGTPLYEQVIYAAKKAVVSGQLRPGDSFPSVRALSTELKINQNTAHKVISHLVAQGVLEVHSSIGTVVARQGKSSAAERSNLLLKEVEQLVVEAKKLGLDVQEVTSAVEKHWKSLEGAHHEQNRSNKGPFEKVWQNVSAGPGQLESGRGQHLRPAGSKRRG